jgi:twitching motility protein PilT
VLTVPELAGAPLRTPEHIGELLEHCLLMGGSDLHLAAGAAPTARVNGELVQIDGFTVLLPDVIERLVFAILTERKIAEFGEELELDTSYASPGKSRFRMNVFRQRGSVGAVLRTIPFHIPDFQSLHMPAVITTFAQLPRGLVLVTGPTGSGKTTTLASLLDIINRTKAVHILSCEDPIEFLYSHQKAIVNQREVGADTKTFASALKRALREDPDVIVVGEMRDYETIHMALTAAETGHLVFATLHTQSAPQTVDRIVDVFPPDQQGQIRVMLATTLQAVAIADGRRPTAWSPWIRTSPSWCGPAASAWTPLWSMLRTPTIYERCWGCFGSSDAQLTTIGRDRPSAEVHRLGGGDVRPVPQPE